IVVASAAVDIAHAGAIAASIYHGIGLVAVVCGYAHATPLAYSAAAPVAKAAVARMIAITAIAHTLQPYHEGYESVDEDGTKQARTKFRMPTTTKKGSYSFTDAHGIARHVDYVTDAAGCRATIKTNEPGTALSAPVANLYNVAMKAAAAAPMTTDVHAPAYSHYQYIVLGCSSL
ncbi:hypothetical protein BIW11_00494, partial [Tropilaelaps mercedesae]